MPSPLGTPSIVAVRPDRTCTIFSLSRVHGKGVCSTIYHPGVHGYGFHALALHGSYSEDVPTQVAVIAESAAPFGGSGWATAPWERVSAGDRHSCIIDTDGALYCMGELLRVGLGGGSGRRRMGRTNVATCKNGVPHAGYHSYGRLGISGVLANVRVPTTVTAPSGVSSWASVSAGGAHTCAIAANGSLYCFGE